MRLALCTISGGGDATPGRITGYAVEVKGDAGGLEVANVTGAVLTRTFGAGAGELVVSVGLTFRARLIATNAVGRGQWSEWGSVVVASPPGPPTAVLATVAGPLSVNVTWIPPRDRGVGEGVAYPITGYGVICVLSAGGGSRYVEVGGGESSAVSGTPPLRALCLAISAHTPLCCTSNTTQA